MILMPCGRDILFTATWSLVPIFQEISEPLTLEIVFQVDLTRSCIKVGRGKQTDDKAVPELLGHKPL